jgi:NADPH:quinone reductase-like Zn-dependent oxidoreductase
MRAARIHRYGDAGELVVEEAPRPECGPDDVRIEVHATSVNPVDAKIRKGGQRAVIRPSFPATLGMDVSGVVTEVGARVRDFAVGDEVYATPSHKRMGCYAEEVVVRAAEVAPKSRRLDHREAASLPLVGLTAWDVLVGFLRVARGQRVLITAGSGGVGTIAIQLAKHLGAEVLTTCSAGNAELVRSLGADVAIDYRAQRFEEVARGVDAVLEAVGGGDIDRALATVRRGGRVAIITAGLPDFTARLGPALGLLRMGVRYASLVVRAALSGRTLRLVTRDSRGANLRKLGELVDAGAIRPVIGRVFLLDEIAEAHRYLETGRAPGKVVIAVR